jgi:hypothetical protein
VQLADVAALTKWVYCIGGTLVLHGYLLPSNCEIPRFNTLGPAFDTVYP